jgi:adenosylcobyric acid synthase
MTHHTKVIQICGTGSGVGKSAIVAGLCRLFVNDGYRVAPFKAQNMALNSAVTPKNLEIGRAQAMQAEACRIEPTADMNPVLLKPTGDTGCQVILRGKPFRNMSVREYTDFKPQVFKMVRESLDKLMSSYDVVVIEGAGSPVEINLKRHDIVNMKIATAVKSPVLLVGDIDRGGVFAWLLGTMGLLTKSEQKLVKGFIINKFRGDKTLLDSGLDFLEKKTGKKVVGVVPYFRDIRLPEEDSQFLGVKKECPQEGGITIAVIQLPRISNFTDFDVFEHEPGVSLKYTIEPAVLEKADCIIIPGTKNTCADLEFLHEKGLAKVIRSSAKKGIPVVGICGGYQMLGKKIIDRSRIESSAGMVSGLALLDAETIFEKEKKTFQVEGIDLHTGYPVRGYEIHHGTTTIKNGEPVFLIEKRGDRKLRIKDGMRSHDGRIWGTYIHGIFDNFQFRKWFLNTVRAAKGLETITPEIETHSPDEEYDKLARLLRANLDIMYLYKILNGEV